MTSPLHILIVEDSPGDAFLIAKMLAAADGRFQHARVETVAEAIETAASTAVDLILLDLNLPDSQGLDTLVKIHGRLPAIPLIVLTGLTDEAAGLEAIHLGAQDYLVKGEVDARQLSRAIRYALERKQAEDAIRKNEELIRNILENVDEGFVVIAPDYRIITANRAYCQLAQLPLAEVIGRYCYEVSHRRDNLCFEAGEDCAPRHTFRTGKPCLSLHIHRDSQNTARHIETKSFPIRDAAGRIVAVIETLVDITEKRVLEAQLRQAQKMEVIGRLAGGIAHDFNNMLSVIIGYAGIMKFGKRDDHPDLPHIKEILAAGERAARLTKGLLAFSRKQIMDIKPVDLNDIIDGFRKMLIRVIGEDISLKFSLAQGVLPVLADRGQIEQVLLNLATNARDAMPRGGELRIETGSARIDEQFLKMHPFAIPGRYGRLSFSDTGMGMDEKTREQIFEPFFTTKETGKGTGLGLSIVYGIVKQHNGFVLCESEIGRGTTFSLYLPPADAQDDGQQTETIEQSPRHGTETVLLAEDDESIRDFLRETLEMFGYRVIVAADGQEAVMLFAERREAIQLLLFDLIMPRKNGKEAYEEIKIFAPGIRVLFMSGYATDILNSPLN